MIGQTDCHKAGAGVLLIGHRGEEERRGLPVQVGAEVAHHLVEHLDVLREHVVAVDLHVDGDAHSALLMGKQTNERMAGGLTFMLVKFLVRSNSNIISTYPLGKLALLQPT